MNKSEVSTIYELILKHNFTTKPLSEKQFYIEVGSDAKYFIDIGEFRLFGFLDELEPFEDLE